MIARVTMSLSELRRRLPDGLVARQYGSFVQIYGMNPPRYAGTDEQRAVADALNQAAAAWRSFEPARRQAWNDYVRRHERLFRHPRRTGGPNGWHVYSQAARRRLMLGLGPDFGPPALLPPGPLTALRLEPAGADPREFRFMVEHRLTPGPGHVVIVRLTPPTRGPGRRPRRGDSRPAAGWSAASARELPPTGGVVAYENALFAVPPGRRFGVYARVVRVADGLAGPELACDFVRL